MAGGGTLPIESESREAATEATIRHPTAPLTDVGPNIHQRGRTPSAAAAPPSRRSSSSWAPMRNTIAPAYR